MAFQVTHTSFPITFESIEDSIELEKQKMQDACVKATKTGKARMKFKLAGLWVWPVRELYTDRCIILS